MILRRCWPLLWGAVLFIAWAIYACGLSGSFIFDDAPNLNALSAINEGTPSELLSFSLQGIAGPLGRPLSLLTFALQHESWPDAPGNFKRINVLIHLANATLVLWLFMVVQRIRKAGEQARIIVPVAAATLWLLWPVNVSSVLYVVQRMTLLSATSMLVGLLLYVYARQRAVSAGHPTWQAHLLLLLSIGVGVVVGVLCKENAIVFSLLALTLNATLFNGQPAQPRPWTAFLWLPPLALLTYLLTSDGVFSGYAIRDFDMVERLLTQPRVLWMYVLQILLPSTESLRFLYDSYAISRSLLSPPTTLISLFLLLTFFAWAWWSRIRFPIFSFAVLFFLASHALESTALPLELVFEHRNYVGSIAIAFAIATIGHRLASSAASGSGRVTMVFLGIGYLAAVSLVTWNLTNLWGNPMVQKRLWLEHNPDSPRVHMEYSHQLLLEGYAEAAAHHLEKAVHEFPEELGFYVARVELGCYYPELRPGSLANTELKLRTGNKGILQATSFLDRLAVAITESNCEIYRPEEVLSLIEAARSNPSFAMRQQDMFILAGTIHSFTGDTDAARAALQQAIAIYPKPQLLIQGAMWELGNGNQHEAARYLQSLHQLQESAPMQYLALRADIEELDRRLAQAVAN